MSPAVVGRADELEAIEAFLDALAVGSAALVFEGEPGIGKTTLLQAGIDAAHDRGARVLSYVASASEARLSYGGLGDLLAGVDGQAVERLPDPQREALDAALLRAGPGAAGVDRRAVATAVLSVLEALAEERPVVVAVDDLQWLDRPSARVLEFCARRLGPGIGLLVSRRTGEGGATWRADLARLGGPGRVEVRQLAPLSVRELQGVLREHVERPLERRALARVHEASGGNPFYALELSRALPAGAPPSPSLPLPSSLDEIVAARLKGLDARDEEVLLAVAALADPTVALLERTFGEDVYDRLDEAERRGMIELHGSHLRFAHPLLENGVYARTPSGRRRAMHRRLSAAVSDVEERARHLAFAGLPEAVGALEEAARHVRARGAPDAAAELLELALGLGGGNHLRVRAAECHFDAGDPGRARALLEEALPELSGGHERARALLLLADIRYTADSFGEARELLEQAREEEHDDVRLRAMVDLRLMFALFSVGLVPDSRIAAQSALEYAEELGDAALLGPALGATVIVDFCLGRGLDEERLERALALGDPDVGTPAMFFPSVMACCLYHWTGRIDEARELLISSCGRWAERGEEQSAAWSCFLRVWMECMAGDLAAATAAANEGVERLFQLDTNVGHALALAARAQLAAHAGRVEEARREAHEALTRFEDAAWEHAMMWPVSTLGFVEMSVGDHEAAAATLGQAADAAVTAGMPEPTVGAALFAGDAAEALAAVGRTDEAERLVALLEERGAALDRAWAIAVGARCRAILLAADGDLASAEEALERALVAHERLAMPIERARTLLVLGRIRRRARKRRAARAVLEEALAIFEAVGSPRWAEQAMEEIAGLGLRPGDSDELTPSEERVARLAASGRTNVEVASTLMVSPKTVEAHLARAYRKLGIRSRAQLGAHMAERVSPSAA